MLKPFLFATLLATTCLANAGSCSECLATENYEWSACQGDEICRTRAKEKGRMCQIGCENEPSNLKEKKPEKVDKSESTNKK